MRKTISLWLIIIIILMPLVAVVGCQQQVETPSVPTPTPTIAFTRFTNDAWEERIFLIKCDGTGLTQLTLEDNVQEHFPQISPDGTKIAFGRCVKGGTFDIYVMNPDGSGRVKITDKPGNDMPAWSPDGKHIAFMSARDGNPEIYVMGSDGSDSQRLTNEPAVDWFPIWFPDGSKIAFMSNRDGKYKWWLMNFDGSEQRLLADIKVYDEGINVPLMLLQGAWDKVSGGEFFAPLITEEEQCVISISVAEGKRTSAFGDTLNVVPAPDGSFLVLTVFSDQTGSFDLMRMFAGPVQELTNSPEHDIAGSCAVLTKP